MAQLLPQDVVLAIRLLNVPSNWSFQSLGKSIEISQSQCYLAFGRLLAAALVDADQRVTIKGNLFEFLVHGLKYVFPARMGEPVTGIPTAYAAPVLRGKLLASDTDKPVWRHDEGKAKGREVIPFHKTIPNLVGGDKWLYSVFACIDSIRIGRAREREVAVSVLRELIYGAT